MRHYISERNNKNKYQSLVGLVVIDAELGMEDHGSIPSPQLQSEGS
jgi:hypothetical protein